MTRRSVEITPNHPVIREYQRSLAAIRSQGVEHELGLRRAFETLLSDSARLHNWTLISELGTRTAAGDTIRPDGTLRDNLTLPRGYWEAKDSRDDLDREIERKIRRGYPLSNIIFEDTRRAVLYQNRDRIFEADLGDPRELADLLYRFYAHTEPAIAEFNEAVNAFAQRVPELARGLAEKIKEAHKTNRRFEEAFGKFFELCQGSLNPNIRPEAVDEMLIQHLLTERLFRTVFDNPEFTRRNAIAVEVERVIDALVSRSFSRNEYLRSLDPFYAAIEAAARTITDFSEKQQFLNNIYERFFRGYSVKVADTHGIVYTPPAIVEYMCDAVEKALKEEFGLSLTSPEVQILDPCTGTGNFIVHLMRRMPKRDLPRMYREQLFANEVMLMPYYIAALNIEHAYLELTGQYEPFEGICFVDTLDLAESRQPSLFSERNTERVEREQKAKINVVIGNPPYNVGQLNENDNNKNRKYPVIDKRVSETYTKDSKATNKNALSDAYVKFFRWATDRLGKDDGIVCFVSNNSFVDQIAFDGMRKHLAQDFTRIDHIDLHGNVRRNPKLSGTTHNVFGIQVGVGITVAVRSDHERRVRYHRVPELWRREDKLALLKHTAVEWQTLHPYGGNWLTQTQNDVWIQATSVKSFFTNYCRGVETTRDEWVFDFKYQILDERMEKLISLYNSEIDRWRRSGSPKDVDQFVNTDVRLIKWSRGLKNNLKRGTYASFSTDHVRECMYRAYSKRYLYFDPISIAYPALWGKIFPPNRTNRVICCTNHSQVQFGVLCTGLTSEHAIAGRPGQCFPFYIYKPDGTEQTENITNAALQQYRSHYADQSITKWNIFHSIYGVLHHPGYREKFAENLRRELPRIPFAPNFHAFAEAGRQLAELHINYEDLKPWPLEFIENPAVPFSWHVERMRLNKNKTALTVNESLTLDNIPPETFNYRLGNRSALEWVIDQYRITEDTRSGIRSDPNREDDPEYIVRLVGQVVRLSLETVQIVNSLPEQYTE